MASSGPASYGRRFRLGVRRKRTRRAKAERGTNKNQKRQFSALLLSGVERAPRRSRLAAWWGREERVRSRKRSAARGWRRCLAWAAPRARERCAGSPRGSGSSPMNAIAPSEIVLAYRLLQQSLLAKFGLHALRADDFGGLLQRATELCAEGMNAQFAKVLEYQPEESRLLVRGRGGLARGRRRRGHDRRPIPVSGRLRAQDRPV